MGERVVWKFTKPLTGDITLDLPQGAELLHVADQEGRGRQLDFWALVDPATKGSEERAIRIAATGRFVAEEDLGGFAHWASVVTAGGVLVWHVFLDHNGARGVPTF